MQFKRVQDLDTQINFDTITQNSRLQIINPTLTGFSGIDTCVGVYVLQGPWCRLDLLFQFDVSWSANAIIDVPICPLTIENVYYPQHLNPLIDVSTAEQINTECPEIIQGPEGQGRITLLNGGSAYQMKLSGIYLRN